MIRLRPPLAVALSLFAGSAFAQTIESCDASFTYQTPPTRAVTLNQQATEIMLALGLEDKLIGTAYLDDAIPEQWAEAYDAIPVLSDQYPAREVVLAEDPDFLFAAFASAFREDSVGTEAQWHDIGVGTYLVNAECRDRHPADVRLTTEPIFLDLERIGALFAVEDRATQIADDIRTRLDAAAAQSPGAGMTAFLFDSGTDTAFSAGCCGAPGLLLESVGLENIAGDVEGRWADLAWEAVVTADPDVIVLIDAEWSTADEKRAFLQADPVLSRLGAVQEENYIVVPFSETLMGLRFVDGVERLAQALAE